MASEAKVLTSEPHLCAPLLLAFLVAPPQVLSLPSEFLLEDEKKTHFFVITITIVLKQVRKGLLNLRKQASLTSQSFLRRGVR